MIARFKSGNTFVPVDVVPVCISILVGAGSPAAASARQNPAKGSQLNAVHPTRVHAPKLPKQERDVRMPNIPATTDPSQQLDPSQTPSGQPIGVGENEFRLP